MCNFPAGASFGNAFDANQCNQDTEVEASRFIEHFAMKFSDERLRLVAKCLSARGGGREGVKCVNPQWETEINSIFRAFIRKSCISQLQFQKFPQFLNRLELWFWSSGFHGSATPEGRLEFQMLQQMPSGQDTRVGFCWILWTTFGFIMCTLNLSPSHTDTHTQLWILGNQWNCRMNNAYAYYSFNIEVICILWMHFVAFWVYVHVVRVDETPKLYGSMTHCWKYIWNFYLFFQTSHELNITFRNYSCWYLNPLQIQNCLLFKCKPTTILFVSYEKRI